MKKPLKKNLKRALKKASKKSSVKTPKTPPTKLLRKLSKKSSKKPALKRSKNRIKKTLREKASPRHVPAIILEMPEAPYTLNMKKVESTVTHVIHGRPVSNRDALMNPQVLDYFEKIVPELQK